MVPLSAVSKVTESLGQPRDALQRLSGGGNQQHARAQAIVQARPKPRYGCSSTDNLPRGVAYEWFAELTYQRILAGDAAIYVYPLCLLLVFPRAGRALRKSFRLLLAIILIVPMYVPVRHHRRLAQRQRQQHLHADWVDYCSAGLAYENAILIVEFAMAANRTKACHRSTRPLKRARLRLRPILMTSIAFHRRCFPAGCLQRHMARKCTR